MAVLPNSIAYHQFPLVDKICQKGPAPSPIYISQKSRSTSDLSSLASRSLDSKAASPASNSLRSPHTDTPREKGSDSRLESTKYSCLEHSCSLPSLPLHPEEQDVADGWPLRTSYRVADSGASSHSNNASSFDSAIWQEEAKPRWDSEFELQGTSRSLLRAQKYCLIFTLLSINGTLIYVSVVYWQAYYFFIILVSSNTVLQAFMALCICLHLLLTRFIGCCFPKQRKEKKAAEKPQRAEKIVMLLPCYNETYEELKRSLDSLVWQKNIEDHQKLIFIVVDGNAKGAGMGKTTQEYLLEDILGLGRTMDFENGYRARDGFYMPIKTQSGIYQGIPYLFVGKSNNQGKRDSLCFARSFLYHLVKKSNHIESIFNQEVFEYLGRLFVHHGMEDSEYLVGMDADTVFDENCVWEMVKQIRKDHKVVGVCGHVCVDFDGSNFGFWSLYQFVEYSQTQGLRRMFQSRITGKVNCLPGCCQLIKIEEATFGDHVLRERFGYVPKPNQNMTYQIMGNYSEDSIHASIIFSLHPNARTAQALRAKAFTIVPQNWTVFLSQRKRWALGSISNEFVMILRPGIIFIERIQSTVAVVTWAITPFIFACVIELIIIIITKGGRLFADKVFVGLMCLLWFRYMYSLCIVFWLPRNQLEKTQYFVGFFMHIFTSPFVNFAVLGYSLIFADDFKWGKTREVVGNDIDAQEEEDVRGRPLSQL